MNATAELFAEVICHCGRRYDAATFAQLPLVGTQRIPAGDGEPAQDLELRNCACGSTRALPVSPERAAWLAHRVARKNLDQALKTGIGIAEAATAERRAWGALRRAVDPKSTLFIHR